MRRIILPFLLTLAAVLAVLAAPAAAQAITSSQAHLYGEQDMRYMSNVQKLVYSHNWHKEPVGTSCAPFVGPDQAAKWICTARTVTRKYQSFTCYDSEIWFNRTTYLDDFGNVNGRSNGPLNFTSGNC
jgi:hypothetical protein